MKTERALTKQQREGMEVEGMCQEKGVWKWEGWEGVSGVSNVHNVIYVWDWQRIETAIS